MDLNPAKVFPRNWIPFRRVLANPRLITFPIFNSINGFDIQQGPYLSFCPGYPAAAVDILKGIKQSINMAPLFDGLDILQDPVQVALLAGHLWLPE